MADLPHRVAVATLLTGDEPSPVSEIPVYRPQPVSANFRMTDENKAAGAADAARVYPAAVRLCTCLIAGAGVTCHWLLLLLGWEIACPDA